MKKSVASFIAVMLVIVLLGLAAVMGFTVGDTTVVPSVFGQDGIRRGLDLVGGSSITYEANLPEGYNTGNLEKDMNTVQAMLRARLTAQGLTEANVVLQGDRRVTVEIPAIKNPEEAVQTLGKTAQLTFVNAAGEEFMNGADVESAKSAFSPIESNGPSVNHVELTFKKDAVSKWAAATKAAANATDGSNYIAIMMDEDAISVASVAQQYAAEGINSQNCIISGNFTAESAAELANLINIGQLPFTLSQDELRTVGPELGSNALHNSFLALVIGVILIALLMLVVYRLPGFISIISLGFFMVIEAIILSVFHINLSLPGIAGIVLSVGMAVDANVIIFERIKEELRAGKSVKASIDSGFKRAFTAILDSNVTTLIAAVVLYFLGTGTVVGFAMTLGLGVIVSMFTALTVTHFLLNRMVDFRIKNPKVYGA